MVCQQDGFHVMNGREAINLTTEANLICQTDYMHDQVDACPRRVERPVQKPCCHNSETRSKLPSNVVQKAEDEQTQTKVSERAETTEIATETSTASSSDAVGIIS